MQTVALERQSVDSFEIAKEIEIKAPIEIAYATVIDVLGPDGEMPDGKPFPMKFEAWPGGRWYRDLGNNSGHLWGHVQVIKPPTLIEICGPLMMSYAAANHLQYRLKAEGNVTRVEFCHKAMGAIDAQHRDGLSQGWGYWMEHIRKVAESRNAKGLQR
jgi:hypothetical protein